jgi:hypothetical protein
VFLEVIPIDEKMMNYWELHDVALVRLGESGRLEGGWAAAFLALPVDPFANRSVEGGRFCTCDLVDVGTSTWGNFSRIGPSLLRAGLSNRRQSSRLERMLPGTAP